MSPCGRPTPRGILAGPCSSATIGSALVGRMGPVGIQQVVTVEVIRSQTARNRTVKLLLAGGGTLVLATLALGIPGRLPSEVKLCAFKGLTGVDCPGCGLTRGLMALLSGDVSAALSYHPLSPVFLALLALGTGVVWWDGVRDTTLLERLWTRAGLPVGVALAVALVLVRLLR